MIKDLVASPQNLEAKIQLVFRTMDMDNDRKISPTELQLALDKFGQLVTDKEAVDIVNTFDRDNDGYINYDGKHCLVVVFLLTIPKLIVALGPQLSNIYYNKCMGSHYYYY